MPNPNPRPDAFAYSAHPGDGRPVAACGGLDVVQEASEDSFPASDPPAWTARPGTLVSDDSGFPTSEPPPLRPATPERSPNRGLTTLAIVGGVAVVALLAFALGRACCSGARR
jgi:hypothetical protein